MAQPNVKRDRASSSSETESSSTAVIDGGKTAAARRKEAVDQMQDLLHEALIDSGHVQRCALVRRKDGALRSASLGYQPSKKSISVIVNNFKSEPMERRKTLEFDGKMYTCRRNDYMSLYAKETGNPVKSYGLVATITASFILIGLYTQDMSASICVECVEKLGEYLREKGK